MSGKSVSRIGGKAQHPAIAQEAGHMKLDYLQFLELEVFTRFGARLEASIEAKIKRGRMLREALKQDRLSPMPVEFQMAWLVAFNEGLLDAMAPGDIPAALAASRKESRRAGFGWKRATNIGSKRSPAGFGGRRMSNRRDLETKIHSLNDIKEIMNAMKNLSLMETHRLARFLEHATPGGANVESVAADFLQFSTRTASRR